MGLDRQIEFGQERRVLLYKEECKQRPWGENTRHILRPMKYNLDDWAGKFDRLNSLQKRSAYELNTNLVDLKY